MTFVLTIPLGELFAKDLDTTVGLFKVVDVIGFRNYSPSWLRLAFAVPTSIVWSLAES